MNERWEKRKERINAEGVFKLVVSRNVPEKNREQSVKHGVELQVPAVRS
ncbi:hypothetical protein V6669_27635 [Paenibacillus sp. Y5S-9]